jgi:hypothetical protein
MRKKRDFEVWLMDIHNIPEVPRLKWEAMKYFKQYMEVRFSGEDIEKSPAVSDHLVLR